MQDRIGTVIDGKYEVLKCIGRGGMSTVYLSMDKRLNKQWAIKEIKKFSSDANNQVVVQSLLAEANLMKRLDHPALPRIVDIIDSGETIYIVMDYIEGESLDKILKGYGAQPQELVIEWAKQLCDVLHYLHSQNPPIIYRDMKPANVMLKPEGNLKVIDFGIAKEFKAQNLADTTALGTRGYAAPEQWGGKSDPRTDIFSLGVTLYHLVTGKSPLEDPFELIPIRQWNPALSGGLERIIQKCTASDPENRYQSCAELMFALEHYEREDDAYRRRQKGKLRLFAVSAALCVLCLATGFTTNALAVRENNQDYEIKVNISTSADYDTREQSYVEAIGIIGNDPRAYLRLLELYRDNGQFGDKQSEQFSALFNQNKHLFAAEDEDFLYLNYEIGLTYFYSYTGGDNSFRTRVLKSKSFFDEIVDTGFVGFEYASMARGYQTICSFYNEYVVQGTGVKEPSAEAYGQLLDSLELCIQNIEDYDYEDAAYSKLTMYNEILNLLNEHRKGLAASEIPQQQVLDLITDVSGRAGSLAVTQTATTQLQQDVLQKVESYRDSIQRAYENTEWRA